MAGKIYLREKDGLVAMIEAPYDAEEVLQKLLADYPDLLAGDQMRPGEPRRWLLITREAGIPDADGAQPRWSLDHLFVDQDAIPTLVEVKRSSDTRLRREVVGQMLDYAANLVAYWPASQLRQTYEDRRRPDDSRADDELVALLGQQPGDAQTAAHLVDEFWERAAANLASRHLRLVFVADVIPPELQRVIEFLNENLVRAEVLGVEVKQYVGEGRQTLVPRVIGRTAAAEDLKQASTGATRVARSWTEAEFLAAASETGGPETERLVRAGIDWNRRHDCPLLFGRGKYGPLYLLVNGASDTPLKICNVNTTGLVMVQYDSLVKVPPFDEVELRLELNRRLNAIEGVSIAEHYAVDATWPSTRLGTEAVAPFLEVLDWVAASLSAAAQGK